MKTLLSAKLNGRIAEQFVRPTVFYSFIDDRYIHIIHEKNENLVGLQYFRSINHIIYIRIQVPEIIPPNLLHLYDLPRKSTANKIPQLFINIA